MKTICFYQRYVQYYIPWMFNRYLNVFVNLLCEAVKIKFFLSSYQGRIVCFHRLKNDRERQEKLARERLAARRQRKSTTTDDGEKIEPGKGKSVLVFLSCFYLMVNFSGQFLIFIN